MRLGHQLFFSIGSPNLVASQKFYRTLGFHLTFTNEEADQLLAADGRIVLHLFSTRKSSIEIVYCCGELLTERIESLDQINISLDKSRSPGVTFVSPEGLSVRLVPRAPFPLPIRDGLPGSHCGRFYEISLETIDLNRSLDFWSTLGFELEFRDPPDSDWATISDGVLRLGLYTKGACPHKFRNPSLTFFEPDMAERIKLIKYAGIQLAQKIGSKSGNVEEAIVESPEGIYLFLFHCKGDFG